MNVKILFLDIDGVLSIKGDTFKKERVRDGLTIPYMWNIIACDELNNIIKETDCEIVLSSDWRKHYTLLEMRELLEYQKINGRRLIGYTEIDPRYTYSRDMISAGAYRSEEINKWIGLHKIENWCAVDDLKLSMLDSERFVRTRPEDGLIQEGISKQIITILNGEQ